MKKFDVELSVGLFTIAGIICLGYLSIKLGKMEVLGSEGYEVYAVFSNSGGLKPGASILIAGVHVGRIKHVNLEDYQARVTMNLEKKNKNPGGCLASIKTKGLLGVKYVEITAGGSEKTIQAGDRIRETQPAVDFEQLISNYVFGEIN